MENKVRPPNKYSNIKCFSDFMFQSAFLHFSKPFWNWLKKKKKKTLEISSYNLEGSYFRKEIIIRS